MKELQQFIETINKAMPGAWEAAVRQVYMLGVLYALATVVCGGVAIWIYTFLNGGTKKEDHKSTDAEAIAFLIMCFLGVAALIALWFTATHFINPEYQAIRLLKP